MATGIFGSVNREKEQMKNLRTCLALAALMITAPAMAQAPVPTVGPYGAPSVTKDDGPLVFGQYGLPMSLRGHTTPLRPRQPAGAMFCGDLNSAHDPAPVRAWLSGYLSGAAPDVIIEGHYQDAAAAIGEICYHNPHWTLEMAARSWAYNYKRGGQP
jgi:hypothetical protein